MFFYHAVNARVCYIGDEASSIKGEPPLKLLPDQNPCECTEFRPGGVNTKRQAKPREVTFGNDGHPEGWTDKDCVKGMTTKLLLFCHLFCYISHASI